MTNLFTFSQACEYLSLSPEELTALREQGLAIRVESDGKQTYPEVPLKVTQHLLRFGRKYRWSIETLAWYADLLFAAEIGRAVLLPLNSNIPTSATGPSRWLETPYAVTVLDDLQAGPEQADSAITLPLRSLITFAVGEGRFWPDTDSLKRSVLYPIITHFEKINVPILGQGESLARDVGTTFAAMMYAYSSVTTPLSDEFATLVRQVQNLVSTPTTPPHEKDVILRQPLIPVDKIYAAKINEIHSQPAAWDFKLGVLKADRRTIAIQLKLPLETDQALVDNILDMVRPFLGVFGARVVQLLYEVANDPPYFRNPVITVDTNEMLDRLGLKRDSRDIHRSKNRERLRDALNAAHALEIVGEYTAWENGRQVRKTFYRTVLSILGATFDAEENASLSTLELRTRGLPKSLQIRLNFYDGIRRPDGKLGNQFVLMSRLAEPNTLEKANYAATHERLRAYLFFRYRQTRMESRQLTITRQTALKKAQISTRNVTRATQILTQALEKLVVSQTLEQFEPVPLKGHQSFTVVLSKQATDKQTD